ncbi:MULTISPECIES: hypothetical protein [Mycolicibacterium]|uniref:Ribonuclease toxin n=1 Tax=Mycobacterium phage Bipper TaxID=1805457 RepID=A0A142F2H0_9CAUD|nr:MULTISPECIES: hypothetical protein [Mycolicibacterium]YP_009303189.1 ribonuclease toxin [Mycobacterium phage Bipper]QDF19328.1 BrnT-like toxin [Mycobacterium phage Cracklewink]AMQ66977.1 BrnT-like toxin [Mycobacterium phage Bipper]MCC9181055.1 hypothetical protein [Mycolicibacterium mageritense]UBV14775.1 hypothetical protein H8Z57_29435 [Mycolicibacterium fortuitum]
MGQTVKIASRARRHGGGRARIIAAMRHCQDPQVSEDRPGVVEFRGLDDHGKGLVILVRDGDRRPNELVVFHVHPVAFYR